LPPQGAPPGIGQLLQGLGQWKILIMNLLT
jgi:hypothetical protein